MPEFLPTAPVGSFDREAASLLLEDVVATILDIVVKAWPHVVSGQKVGPSSREDDISDELRWQMDSEKKRRRPVPQLRFEREPQSDRPAKDRDVGYIDVYVIYSWEQEQYFAMECKRVTDADRKLARCYVSEGIVRFSGGKYSLRHPFGAIVGFVCSGQCADAANFIDQILSAWDRSETGLLGDPPWHRERRFAGTPDLFSTRHRQSGTQHDITLLHLFLGFSTA